MPGLLQAEMGAKSPAGATEEEDGAEAAGNECGALLSRLIGSWTGENLAIFSPANRAGRKSEVEAAEVTEVTGTRASTQTRRFLANCQFLFCNAFFLSLSCAERARGRGQVD